MGEDITPIGAHFLGMETKHRVETTRIPLADRQDSIHRIQINTRHKNLPYPSLLCSGNDLIKVGLKLLTVKVGMGIYEGH